MNVVRDCLVCGEPIPVRQHQALYVRTCSPGCAKTLAVRENPDLETRKKLVPINTQLNGNLPNPNENPTEEEKP